MDLERGRAMMPGDPTAGKPNPRGADLALRALPADAEADRLMRFLTLLSRFGLAAGREPLLKPVEPGS